MHSGEPDISCAGNWRSAQKTQLPTMPSSMEVSVSVSVTPVPSFMVLLRPFVESARP